MAYLRTWRKRQGRLERFLHSSDDENSQLDLWDGGAKTWWSGTLWDTGRLWLNNRPKGSFILYVNYISASFERHHKVSLHPHFKNVFSLLYSISNNCCTQCFPNIDRNACFLQVSTLSRIGGKVEKDCVHKCLDRYVHSIEWQAACLPGLEWTRSFCLPSQMSYSWPKWHKNKNIKWWLHVETGRWLWQEVYAGRPRVRGERMNGCSVPHVLCVTVWKCISAVHASFYNWMTQFSISSCRLMSNHVQAQFNMDGKGQKKKLPFGSTKSFGAIKGMQHSACYFNA